MTARWQFWPEDSSPYSEPRIACYDGKTSDIKLGDVTDEQGAMLAEALNIHGATGLTPAQLQARVAELEEAVLKLSADVQIARGGVQQLKDFANQYPSRITPAVNTVVDSILEATA